MDVKVRLSPEKQLRIFTKDIKDNIRIGEA